MVAEELTPMLTDVFQSSINEGYVPSQWREANVCGIYKKGQKTEPSNYRPVSLTSVICKILEHIVHSHIMGHLEQHKILVDNQHGFRSKHSTETQLILTTNDIARSLEKGETIHMAILDFAKAFDKVPHERLLGKLDHYGIRGPLHMWIRHFLTDRTQKVVCNGAESQPKRVTSSVPQGTVTGPLQFLIYINDLPKKLKNNVRLFADDCVVYASGKTTAELSSLQADLKILEEWQNTWAMEFNASKCYIMKFTNSKQPPDLDYSFCNQPLKVVPSNPYLGIEFDNQLNWGTHIEKTVSKANRVLGVLKRNLWFCAKEVKETAYKTLVRPILEYGSCAWAPYKKTHIKKVESVQRKAARFCMQDHRQRSSVTKMLTKLDWETLEDRRRKDRMTMTYKIRNDLVGIVADKYFQTPRAGKVETRNNSKSNLTQMYPAKDVYKYSFIPRASREWNQLPIKAREAKSLEAFKNVINK